MDENSITIEGPNNMTANSISTVGIGGSSGTAVYHPWGYPEFIKAQEVGKTVEFLYKETSTVSYLTYPPCRPDQRVFKIVFSCKEGKWHKSEPIYGTIVPPSDEYYDFD